MNFIVSKCFFFRRRRFPGRYCFINRRFFSPWCSVVNTLMVPWDAATCLLMVGVGAERLIATRKHLPNAVISNSVKVLLNSSTLSSNAPEDSLPGDILNGRVRRCLRHRQLLHKPHVGVLLIGPFSEWKPMITYRSRGSALSNLHSCTRTFRKQRTTRKRTTNSNLIGTWGPVISGLSPEMGDDGRAA